MDDENHTRRLCGAAQNGDPKAASELLVLFHKKIHGYFRRLCSAETDAEDLTQRVFCKVWASLPAFQGNASVATWIYRISYHVYVDWRRRSNRIEPQTEACSNSLTGEADDQGSETSTRAKTRPSSLPTVVL